MQPKNLEESLKKVKQSSNKRNFKQNFELIINLKDIDIKKTEHQLDLFVPLPFSSGKQVKICALVGPELEDEAKKNCDTAIVQADFIKYSKDKKETKRLAKKHDFFIAQANIMPQVAQAFGRVFGPRGKMPNPKAGCIVPPKATLSPLVAKLKKTSRIVAKTQPMVQLAFGKEDMSEKELSDNLITVYNQIIHNLPGEKNNIKSVFIKLTMGPSFVLDLNGSIIEKKAESQKSEISGKLETSSKFQTEKKDVEAKKEGKDKKAEDKKDEKDKKQEEKLAEGKEAAKEEKKLKKESK